MNPSSMTFSFGHSGLGVRSFSWTWRLWRISHGMHNACIGGTVTGSNGSLTSLGQQMIGGAFRQVYINYIYLDSDVQKILQSTIPSHAKPFCIILYADKTRLSSFSTEKGYPVVARCANLPVSVRNGDGIGGGRLVGWLPIVRLNCLKTDTTDELSTARGRFPRIRKEKFHKTQAWDMAPCDIRNREFDRVTHRNWLPLVLRRRRRSYSISPYSDSFCRLWRTVSDLIIIQAIFT